MRWRRARPDVAADAAGPARTSTIAASRFLDTNILVYLFDRDAPEKAERTREILSATGNVVSTQVLQEFYVSVRKKLGLPGPEASQALGGMASSCRVVTVELPQVLAAAERSVRQQLSFWDALIVEAALAAGCQVILSEDLQDGREYEPGLRVENPYASVEPARARRRTR